MESIFIIELHRKVKNHLNLNCILNINCLNLMIFSINQFFNLLTNPKFSLAINVDLIFTFMES